MAGAQIVVEATSVSQISHLKISFSSDHRGRRPIGFPALSYNDRYTDMQGKVKTRLRELSLMATGS